MLLLCCFLDFFFFFFVGGVVVVFCCLLRMHHHLRFDVVRPPNSLDPAIEDQRRPKSRRTAAETAAFFAKGSERQR